jgi:hypothetical protein
MGPSGPTGPQGPAGAGSSLLYAIHYYQSVETVPAAGLGGDSTDSATEYCPASETPIAASCGYQAPTVTADQHNLVVNYSGLDSSHAGSGTPTGGQCLVSNSATNTRNIIVGVSCFASSSASSTNASAAVVKSCTYDPDTQKPCTAADAVAATQMNSTLFQSAKLQASSGEAQAAAETSVSAATVDGNGTRKTKKTVTLWFREPAQ